LAFLLIRQRNTGDLFFFPCQSGSPFPVCPFFEIKIPPLTSQFSAGHELVPSALVPVRFRGFFQAALTDIDQWVFFFFLEKFFPLLFFTCPFPPQSYTYQRSPSSSVTLPVSSPHHDPVSFRATAWFVFFNVRYGLDEATFFLFPEYLVMFAGIPYPPCPFGNSPPLFSFLPLLMDGLFSSPRRFGRAPRARVYSLEAFIRCQSRARTTRPNFSFRVSLRRCVLVTMASSEPTGHGVFSRFR